LSGEFQTYATANYAGYKVSLAEQGNNSAYFVGDFPSAITSAGVYCIDVREQAGGSPAETDAPIGGGDIQWDGSDVRDLSQSVTSGQFARALPPRPTRSRNIDNFMFRLVSPADNRTPFLSGTISGVISKDGGSFGSLASGGAAGAGFNEVGQGWYKANLTSGDLNANTAALQFVGELSGNFSAVAAFSFVLQPTSG